MIGGFEKCDKAIALGLLSVLSEYFVGDHLSYEEEPVALGGGTVVSAYRFKLFPSLHQPGLRLILKIFPDGHDVAELKKSEWVSSVLRGVGVRVPVVHCVGMDLSLFGAPFLVEDFVCGRLLSTFPSFARLAILGESHARLHQLDSSRVIRLIEGHDASLGAYLASSVVPIRLQAAALEFPELESVVEWCLERPWLWSANLAVCHGDYHPGNILIDAGEISGVIDWGFWLANAGMDVAWSATVLRIGSWLRAGNCVDANAVAEGVNAYFCSYGSGGVVDIGGLRDSLVMSCLFALILNLRGWNRVLGCSLVREGLVARLKGLAGCELLD